MNEEIIKRISQELKITEEQIQNTLSMLEEGNTVPFIARYRKEQTKGLDEEQILYIQKQYDYQLKLAERKEAVLKLIGDQGKLTDEIKKSVDEATKLSQVEDIYRPYAQKKKTRATTAIKLGLQPLSEWMLKSDENSNLDLFHERTKEHFDFIAREEMHPYGFEEVVPKGCSKAGGIDYIVEHLGESLDDCYVFGDSTNDLSMLTHVKNSIAMGNSYPEVLANTSYVTTPIERDGIRNALKHFGLI